MENDEIRLLREQRNRLRNKIAQRKQFAERQEVAIEEFPSVENHAIKRNKASKLRDSVNSEVKRSSGSSEASFQGSALEIVQRLIASCLSQPSTSIPLDVKVLARRILKQDLTPEMRSALRELSKSNTNFEVGVQEAINSMVYGEAPLIQLENFTVDGKNHLMITGFDQSGVAMLAGPITHKKSQKASSEKESMPHHQLPFNPYLPIPLPQGLPPQPYPNSSETSGNNPGPKKAARGTNDFVEKDLEEILSRKSAKEREKSKTGEELLELIQRPTAKQSALKETFKSKGGSAVREYCPSLTREDCCRTNRAQLACLKMHFRRIISPHTDLSLGDCSFLDTCRHMKTCKYVHYELDDLPLPSIVPPVPSTSMASPLPALLPLEGSGNLPQASSEVMRSAEEAKCAQWVNCDVRKFPMKILGKFGVIMADPPWDIHMELPYGTMSDEEMRNMDIQSLQSDGVIFLWVTGRAMELGRECLELWGYQRVDELIWVKTNQLQRIIRTGRTGHWLNHSKEHCLIGIKGRPSLNRNVDTDVLVAEVRETSRKPDEMYSLLERLSPNTRKIEIFARMHNKQKGWVSVGNQLDGVYIVDPGMRARFKAAYPEVEIKPVEKVEGEKS